MSTDAKREPEKKSQVLSRRDDVLVVVALLSGLGIAFEGRHVVLELAGGITLALGAALLAVRGGRPIQGRGWIVCALVLGVGGALLAAGLELWQEWDAGQWLAEGPQTSLAPEDLRRAARTLVMMRLASLVGGLGFLLGAITNKIGNEPEQPRNEAQK